MLRRFIRKVRGTTAPPVKTLSSLQAYALWAASYPPHAHNPLMQAEETAMMRALNHLPLSGIDLLDLACGTGRYGRIVGRYAVGRVVSADNSIAMLDAMPPGSLHEGRLCASCEALPFCNAMFDGVICALALGHIPTLTLSMGEIARVLRPGGWALISDLHPALFTQGAQRTFTANGQTFAVEHTIYHDADYRRAGEAAGLTMMPAMAQSLAPDVTPPQNWATDAPVIMVYEFRRD